MGKIRRWIGLPSAVIGVVVLGAGLGAVALFTGARVVASYTVIKPGLVLETVLANGRIAGSKVVPLAFVRTGTIARVPARSGQTVKIGDTLAVLDSREDLNTIVQRRNALAVAQINLAKLSTADQAQALEQLNQARLREELAKKQLDRVETLLKGNAATQSDADNARQAYDLAVSSRKVAETNLQALAGPQTQLQQAQVEQARAALAQAEIERSKAVLRAPENGRVLEIKLSPGEIVSGGVPVLTFLPADTTTHVELLVDEGEVSRIVVGDRAVVSSAAARGRSFSAAVRDILPVIDASKGTATVQLSIAGAATGLLPDQTVTAEIVVDSIVNGLPVEQRFLRFSTATTAFLLRKGTAHEVRVAAREAGAGTYVVDSGLVAGDTVLLAPKLAEGVKVRLSK